MSWFAAIATAMGGVQRHRVQALVISVVLLASTASATLGLVLLTSVDAPFEHAFAAQRGAQLALTVDSGHVTAAQLAATGGVKDVTAVAGPFPTTAVQLSYHDTSLGLRTLAGRTSPRGAVDRVVLSEGHWPTAPGQVVLDAGPGGGPGYPGVGDAVQVSGVPGVRELTVVGFATSITKTADGWVTPVEASLLRTPSNPATEQMLYRFRDATTDAQVEADTAQITHSLPQRAVAGSTSWLAIERQVAGNAAILEPFVVAFALIGLAMAVLIVANLVSGAVVAQYYRIGVLKSIGLTPTQVVIAYLVRIGVPALTGALLGAIAGSLAAVPVLSMSSGIYGIGRPSVPLWTPLAALAGMTVLTALAAVGPAIRAGRLSANQAIAAGRAPRVGRGYTAHRLMSRIRLPRPVTIGLAAPFARPARSLMTAAAIAFGATAVIFALGLNTGLSRAQDAQALSNTAPVHVQLVNPHAYPTVAQDRAVTTVLDARPGTRRYVAVWGKGADGQVPGISTGVTVQAFGGNAAWLGYAIITGHWLSAPGDVVVNTTFLTDSGLTVGDSTTLDITGSNVPPARVRIVGEVFQPSDNPWLLTNTTTLPGFARAQNLQGYEVGLRTGTNPSAYMRSVNALLGTSSLWTAAPPQASQFYGVASRLVGLLAVMVAIAAGLGVLNTVLMSTRDRVRDLGIFKAIGMRPGQMLTMVICWMIGPALLAALIAAPVAMALTTATMHAMASSAHSGMPETFSQVLPLPRLILMSLGAFAIALAGAALPAGWAARARPASALRSE